MSSSCRDRLYQSPQQWFVFAILFGTTAVVPAADDKLSGSDFDDVRAIFEKRCLSCHNDIDQKGQFSLQSHDGLLESGFVSPGQPSDSHLLAVLIGDEDGRASMPQGSDPLTDKDVAKVRRWISKGAVWPGKITLTEPVVENFDWWSFKPIHRVSVPSGSLDDRRWAHSPIDHFISAKHREHGLQHSPPADRRTLIRRVTYDLTGLPPTPEAVRAFVNDEDPAAYQQLVDRLLDSTAYGERWARHWLDVVKYADTCGYDKDKLRPNAFPYRDYVIRSFNEDKPYTRFVREQIAGDVLYPGEPDGILGLGFVAAGPWDFIGHVEVPESKLDGKVARNLDRDEMVTNTLNTFCSVTIQCARCHNHKFDPFTQEHYYSLQSVFAAVDRAERIYDTDPAVEQKRAALIAEKSEIDRTLREIEKQIQDQGGSALQETKQQIAKLTAATKPAAKRPEYGYHSKIAARQNTEKWVEIDLGDEIPVSRVVIHPCHDEFNNINAGFGFPIRFRVKLRSTDEPHSTEAGDFTGVDLPNPGLTPQQIDYPDISARYVRITATKLMKRAEDYNFALAEVEVLDSEGRNMASRARVIAKDSIEAPVRWRKSNLVDGIWPKSADPRSTRQLAEARAERDRILNRILTPAIRKRQEAQTQRGKEIEEEIKRLPKGRVVYAAATQFTAQGNFKPTNGQPRTVKILHRGNIQQPRDSVQPGVIPLNSGADWHLNLPDNHSEADRRAALAEWITDPANPLTWRSIANRVWQYHFGNGIVASPNDLGRMGQLPTHPELLDWLADEFRRTQSFKHLHRLIVHSETYKQSSDWNAHNASIDAGNQYLWKMNRRRLSAEELRDSILAVSGKLNRDFGGPGFYLFALEKTAHSPHYEYHKFDPDDPNSHRRSIYRFIVRSQPDPFMTTLDCADSSQSTPRRTETLTSLQALSLLNNRFNLVMARHFAARVEMSNEPTVTAFELVTGRNPTAAEKTELDDYADQHGMANLCRVLFNLSEFIFLD